MAKGGKREGAGRKKGEKAKLAELYNTKLAQMVEKVKTPIIQALIDRALTGDVPAIKEIHERLMGKVKDEMNLTGDLNHIHDVPENLYKAIIEREGARIKISG